MQNHTQYTQLIMLGIYLLLIAGKNEFTVYIFVIHVTKGYSFSCWKIQCFQSFTPEISDSDNRWMEIPELIFNILEVRYASVSGLCYDLSRLSYKVHHLDNWSLHEIARIHITNTFFQ